MVHRIWFQVKLVFWLFEYFRVFVWIFGCLFGFGCFRVWMFSGFWVLRAFSDWSGPDTFLKIIGILEIFKLWVWTNLDSKKLTQTQAKFFFKYLVGSKSLRLKGPKIKKNRQVPNPMTQILKATLFQYICVYFIRVAFVHLIRLKICLAYF